MGVYSTDIAIITKGEDDIVDITEQVQSAVNQSHLQNGMVCVFIPGSTAAITTMEYEPGLRQDISQALERIAPKKIPYEHHETWHDDNGRSHVKASLLGPSLTVPIKDGTLIHGTWQQIVFLELDTQPRKRTIIVQIIGE